MNPRSPPSATSPRENSLLTRKLLGPKSASVAMNPPPPTLTPAPIPYPPLSAQPPSVGIDHTNGLPPDPQSLLRDSLNFALRDAKRLFDEGIIDSLEFKDLKTHEISQYKKKLSAITSADSPQDATTHDAPSTPVRTQHPYPHPHKGPQSPHTSPAPTTPHTHPASTPPPVKREASRSTTPILRTPTRLRALQEPPPISQRPQGPILSDPSQNSNSTFNTPTPRTARTAARPSPSRLGDAVYLDINTYRRLATPPIFRRRTPQRRRIVVPSGELDALRAVQTAPPPAASRPA